MGRNGMVIDPVVTPVRRTAVVDVAPEDRAVNCGRPMRYFIPDWDDLVDPGFDFVSDTRTEGRVRYHDEVYAHQIYEPPNYDGLLLSRSTVESGVAKSTLIRRIGVHRYTRFQGGILGDCGAFNYIDLDVPPYQTAEILDYYQNLGFNYGVSIDHLIVPAYMHAKEFRYQLTRRNAQEFIELHRSGGYTFTPIGVAQGWDAMSYRDAVAELLDLGYQSIALGGLARARTEDIYQILCSIAPLLREDTDLHLFGVARDRVGNEMHVFRHLGVTSFDSASPLRRAWLGATTNYATLNGKWYAAVRVPLFSEASPRAKRLIAAGVANLAQLKVLERGALTALRDYDRGRLDIDTTLGAVLEIDAISGRDPEHYADLYREVLEARPWKSCHCPVCRGLGIEVIIFRGNDRNRRRGFHNTYVFYKRFRRLLALGK